MLVMYVTTSPLACPFFGARDGSENPPRRLTEAIAAIYRTGGLGAFYVGYGTMVPQLLAEWRNSAFSSRPPARPGDARDPLLVHPVPTL